MKETCLGKLRRISLLMVQGLAKCAPFFDFCPNIRFIKRVNFPKNSNLFRNCQVKSAVDEGVNFFGIIGQKTNMGNSKVIENLKSDTVITTIGTMSQSQIGFDGIQSLFLQFVRFNFFRQANAASFLREVDQVSVSVFFHELE